MRKNRETTGRRRVVIVGAGFAGLWAARHLARHGGDDVDVTLIDRNNYHTFAPLLYQVAAAEIDISAIAYPIRGIFRNAPNVRTVMGEVTDIDVRERLVMADGLLFPYDQLILAAGSRTAFYGIPGAEENAFRLKTLEDATALRAHILSCFERAALEGDAVSEGLLTFAIVGGGTTGLEFAGALAELIANTLRRDFPRLIKHQTRIVLLDAGEEVIMPFAPPLRQYTRKKLENMGIEVITKAGVKSVAPDSVTLADGRVIKAYTIVWTAGVRGEVIAVSGHLPLGKGERVAVTPTLQVAGRPEIHVAGDVAWPGTKKAPLVAPNAKQQGEHVAKNVLLAVNGEAAKEFFYRDKGSMATIGRNAAVAQIGKRSFTGITAWGVWLFVHIAYLIGFRNRLITMVNWTWDYLFSERAVRLIVPQATAILDICGTRNACSAEDAEPEREDDHAG
jgi:NADH dehydrogenase